MNITKIVNDIKKEVFTVFKGNPQVVDMILSSVFAGGHVLLEDVPGTGKTVLAKAISKASGLDFSRVQCTPDLMPSDITGSSIWLPSKQEFEFKAGPIISSIVLVDELNRATPRTQSALLEAMAEGQISVDGKQYDLPEPFFVIATENPVESEGTFPLPEAQKDRFMMTLSIGYPSIEEEMEILTAQNSQVHPVENIKPVTTAQEINEAKKELEEVHIDPAVLEYMVTLSRNSRKDERLLTGVSPRGSLALYKVCKAYAAIQGRNYVLPEDVKLLALPVFRKRLILTGESLVRGYSTENIISELIEQTPIPEFRAHV